MLFLFMEEALPEFRKGTAVTKANFYEFFPWNFGPFSSEVFDDLKFFELRGFVETNLSDDDTTPESASEWALWMSSSQVDYGDDEYSEYQEEEFKLTNDGQQYVEENLYKCATKNQRKLLREFRARLEAVPLRALLRYVYENYPDQTDKSTIVNEIL